GGETTMDTTFKPGDEALEQLVTERRAEVVRLQQGQAERLRDVESRGQQRIRALRASLPKETSDLLERLAKLDDDATAIARSSLADTRKRLLESTPTVSTALHPGLVQGRLLAPHSVGWFTPYYGTL